MASIIVMFSLNNNLVSVHATHITVLWHIYSTRAALATIPPSTTIYSRALYF